jgi:hypothetical protein
VWRSFLKKAPEIVHQILPIVRVSQVIR